MERGISQRQAAVGLLNCHAIELLSTKLQEFGRPIGWHQLTVWLSFVWRVLQLSDDAFFRPSVCAPGAGAGAASAAAVGHSGMCVSWQVAPLYSL